MTLEEAIKSVKDHDGFYDGIYIGRKNEPLQELVAQQNKWLGGKLIDYHNKYDRAVWSLGPRETTITGFRLTDTHFHIDGKDFNWDAERYCLELIPGAPEGGLALCGFAGKIAHITQSITEASRR